MSHSGRTLFGWQNTWESDSQRPRHPRALDNQQLLANEGSKKKRDSRPSGRSPKKAAFRQKGKLDMMNVRRNLRWHVQIEAKSHKEYEQEPDESFTKRKRQEEAGGEESGGGEAAGAARGGGGPRWLATSFRQRR